MAEAVAILGTRRPEAVVHPGFACLPVEGLASIIRILSNWEIGVVDASGSIP